MGNMDNFGFNRDQRMMDGTDFLLVTAGGYSIVPKETADRLAPPEHQPLINLSLVGHTATCHHESQLQVAIMPLESLAVLMGQVEDLRRSLNPKEQARWVGAYDQALINARLSRKAAGGTWRAPDDQG